MEKFEQNGRTKAIREYLAGIGSPISNVQAHEVLARALGLKNKHVLASSAQSAASKQPATTSAVDTTMIAGQRVRVLARDGKPLSVDEMSQLNWSFDFVVPMELDRAGDIDVMNEQASNRITGNDVALEDITFKHVPDVNYGEGWVAFRVSGYVSQPDVFFEDAENEDAAFYRELREMCDRIQPEAEVEFSLYAERMAGRLDYQSSKSLSTLLQYAKSNGANRAELDADSEMEVFVFKPNDESYVCLRVTLEQLKYAEKVDESTWKLGKTMSIKFV